MELWSQCIKCGHRAEGIVPKCPKCGYITQIEYCRLHWIVDKGVPSMWRYSNMLPPICERVSFNEGYTPLRKLGGVLVKMENFNPTRSYADRASSLLVSYMKPKMVRINYVKDFAPSMAYYLASVGARVDIVVDPGSVELDDLLFLDEIGAGIEFQGPSTREEGASMYENPISIEGLKTIAYEIVEASPECDEIFIPAETGLLAYSIGKGLRELAELGLAPEYGLTAVRLKGTPTPKILEYSKYKIKVVEVDSRDALEAVLRLSKMGVKVRPLAATSYAAAQLCKSAIAILTGSSRTVPLTPKNKLSELQAKVFELLGKVGEATAYEIWKGVGGGFTLRGIYKALSSLQARGRIKSNYVMKGSRKVKVYYIA